MFVSVSNATTATNTEQKKHKILVNKPQSEVAHKNQCYDDLGNVSFWHQNPPCPVYMKRNNNDDDVTINRSLSFEMHSLMATTNPAMKSMVRALFNHSTEKIH